MHACQTVPTHDACCMHDPASLWRRVCASTFVVRSRLHCMYSSHVSCMHACMHAIGAGGKLTGGQLINCDHFACTDLLACQARSLACCARPQQGAARDACLQVCTCMPAQAMPCQVKPCMSYCCTCGAFYFADVSTQAWYCMHGAACMGL